MQYNWPLIGHQPIKDYFARAFASGRIHHAYLFEGPAQVGKATFARLLAKTLLCENTESVSKPCNTCRACTAFDHGAHPDVLYLVKDEEKSQISVERTREFIVLLQTRPLLNARRIGIIEEAELMNASGWNALLKTLEEPPGQTVFFIISREPVIPTIVSRCQHIRFRLVSVREIDAAFGRGSVPEVISALSAGRPGLTHALRDPSVGAQYEELVGEIARLLKLDEAGRLLWVSGRFSGRAKPAEKRDECRAMLEVMQTILRRILHDRSLTLTDQMFLERAAMLKRTQVAGAYLASNVDPRLICEYVLLNSEASIAL